MSESKFPRDWAAKRVQRVIDHYDSLSDEEMAAEDDAGWNDDGITMVAVPNHLVNQVVALIKCDQDASRP